MIKLTDVFHSRMHIHDPNLPLHLSEPIKRKFALERNAAHVPAWRRLYRFLIFLFASSTAVGVRQRRFSFVNCAHPGRIDHFPGG